MFITIKKKFILITLAMIFVAVVLFIYFANRPTAMPKETFSVVIDAGHGGIDGGAVGKTTGVTENEINLQYAKTLQSMCEDFGIRVVMTRTNENGLYNPSAKNKKRSDMEKRKKIIDSSNADLVVSLHMNSFPLSSASGAQVFYSKGNQNGEKLASNIQTSLVAGFDNARKTHKMGDFYIINCTEKPGVLVECGYLSNPEEEKNLANANYRKKMCYSILEGIVQFFQMNQ